MELDAKFRDRYEKLLARGIISNCMPTWDDDKRAIVNSIARSAVFGVVERGSKSTLISHSVPAPANYEIVVTGKRLSEAHRDIYMQAMHLFRGREANRSIRITPRDLLLQIERSDGGENRRWVVEALLDISQTTIRIETCQSERRIRFGGSLLTVLAVESKQNARVELSLPFEAVDLFHDDGRTYINARKRTSLKGPGSQLAKALQPKIYSHREPYPMKIDTLATQCGVMDREKAGRKRTFVRALNLLQANGNLESFEICGDTVIMHRPMKGE